VCAMLRCHTWPGNVRELKQVMERALVLGGGRTIGPEHLLLDAGAIGSPSEVRVAARQLVSEAEREELVRALAACGGNQTRAAEHLGISRRTLVRRLARHGLPRPRK